jgi:hypothetical protein
LGGNTDQSWAKTHFRRTGTWPTVHSGSIAGSLAETWHRVDLALRRGYRGLPGRSSLALLLDDFTYSYLVA